jgi:hypothetical protein
MQGAALLAKHADKPADLDAKIMERVFAVARDAACADVAVLVRKRVAKARFLRTAAKKGSSVSSHGVTQIVQALDGLKDGRGRGAVDILSLLKTRSGRICEWRKVPQHSESCDE